MQRLNELLQELGISKVRLAKYLGVSRQMVYNYLELDDLNGQKKKNYYYLNCSKLTMEPIVPSVKLKSQQIT